MARRNLQKPPMAPPIRPRSATVFRLTSGTFALVALAASLWLLAADVLGAQHATAAARIGLIRGDLWAEAALDEARALPAPVADAATAEQRKIAEDVRELATRAATLSPTDSRIWLLL